MKEVIEIYNCKFHSKNMKIGNFENVVYLLADTSNVQFSQEAMMDMRSMVQIDMHEEMYRIVIENFLTSKIPALGLRGDQV